MISYIGQSVIPKCPIDTLTWEELRRERTREGREQTWVEIIVAFALACLESQMGRVCSFATRTPTSLKKTRLKVAWYQLKIPPLRPPALSITNWLGESRWKLWSLIGEETNKGRRLVKSGFLSLETTETWIVYVCHSEGQWARQKIEVPLNRAW